METEKQLLERLYLSEMLSIAAIAERCGVSETTVLNRLAEHGIQRRPRGSSKIRLTVPVSESAEDPKEKTA